MNNNVDKIIVAQVEGIDEYIDTVVIHTFDTQEEAQAYIAENNNTHSKYFTACNIVTPGTVYDVAGYVDEKSPAKFEKYIP